MGGERRGGEREVEGRGEGCRGEAEGRGEGGGGRGGERGAEGRQRGGEETEGVMSCHTPLTINVTVSCTLCSYVDNGT